MKRLQIVQFLFFLILSTPVVFCQVEDNEVTKRYQNAIDLMDNGKIDESISALKEAIGLYPKIYDFRYELAYANYLKKDYKQTIAILNKLKDHKDVTDRLFQLLGNSFDVIGDSINALKIYDLGLNRFPNSGKLYFEKGNVYLNNKNYHKALFFYELGIKEDPKFSSNYYRATLLYCRSTEEVWGMIYGEIFMNLERNSKRTVEISKLLYDTYKSQIQFTSDTSFSVSFSQNANISVNGTSSPIPLPFGIGAYEPTLMMSMLKEKTIDMSSLNRIRTNFINLYFERAFNTKYPNVLFDFQNEIKNAGHLEAYNYWILMKGDEDGFSKWISENKDKWDAFVSWFTQHKINVVSSNKEITR
jgi:tetratricopeptide (TPR) repeat protein